jgi:RNase P/RNase MRP subunit POP5
VTKAKKFVNPIPRVLRGKKRYLKFAFLPSKPFSEKSVWSSVSSVFFQLFGEVGLATQKLWLVSWNEDKCEGIVRCSHDSVENVKAGLLFVQEIEGNKVIPVLLKVSGSIKKLK